MWKVLKYLDAATDLLEDKTYLRKIGLSEEEIDGYEEFFFKNYFPIDMESL